MSRGKMCIRDSFEAEGHSPDIMPRMASASRFIMGFMGAFIAIGWVACALICLLLCGMDPLRAVYHGFCLSVAGATTGGISVMDVEMCIRDGVQPPAVSEHLGGQEAIFLEPRAVDPVSYTHLDVYKRQAQGTEAARGG